MKLGISIRSCGRLGAAALAGLGLVLFGGQTAAGAAHPMPRIVSSNGHRALFVDGALFLMLGAQSHNSSAWPGTLPKPEPGKFDPSIVDSMIIQVGNEPGAWGSIRDYSPAAEKMFAAPVPAEFLKALGGRNGAKSAGGNWRVVFGDNADEYFRENQFLITGSSCTIEFKAASGGHRDSLRVEEAEPLARKPNAKHDGRDYSPASAFRVMRILNGDETDHALPFRDAPQTLRLTLGTY